MYSKLDLQASVLSEGFGTNWTNDIRKQWGVKLSKSSSVEELWQVKWPFNSLSSISLHHFNKLAISAYSALYPFCRYWSYLKEHYGVIFCLQTSQQQMNCWDRQAYHKVLHMPLLILNQSLYFHGFHKPLQLCLSDSLSLIHPSAT